MKQKIIKASRDTKVEYWFYDSPEMEMSEIDQEHVQKQIGEGFIEGELCGGVGGDGETYGWWKMVKE